MYVWVRNRQILILPQEPVCKEQLLKANRAVMLRGSDRRTGSQIVERELGRCLPGRQERSQDVYSFVQQLLSTATCRRSKPNDVPQLLFNNESHTACVVFLGFKQKTRPLRYLSYHIGRSGDGGHTPGPRHHEGRFF